MTFGRRDKNHMYIITTFSAGPCSESGVCLEGFAIFGRKYPKTQSSAFSIMEINLQNTDFIFNTNQTTSSVFFSPMVVVLT